MANVFKDKNNNAKITKFIQSTKTNSPTGDSGATSLAQIGVSFIYIETSSNNNGSKVFVSFARTDIQITNITFCYNRFSILTNDDHKSMGRFRIQLLLADNTWSSRNVLPNNTQYRDNSTDWTSLNLNFTVENFGVRSI